MTRSYVHRLRNLLGISRRPAWRLRRKSTSLADVLGRQPGADACLPERGGRHPVGEPSVGPEHQVALEAVGLQGLQPAAVRACLLYEPVDDRQDVGGQRRSHETILTPRAPEGRKLGATPPDSLGRVVSLANDQGPAVFATLRASQGPILLAVDLGGSHARSGYWQHKGSGGTKLVLKTCFDVQ